MFLLFLFFSCTRDKLEFSDLGTKTTMGTDLGHLRKKVVNPYTIPNMQKALDNILGNIQKGRLKSATAGRAPMPEKNIITPNVLYIKFTPQTAEEEGLLKRDSTLALIDYPLGYVYDEAFFENRSPLKEGEIPAYYTTVAVDRQLPAGVPYEILEKMYLPQKDKNLEDSGKSLLYKTEKGITADFVSVLLQQAFEQTGNEGLDGLGIITKKDSIPVNNFLGIGIGSKWLPRGTLRIWDDNFGSITTTTKIIDHWETHPCDPDDPFETPWDDESEPTGTPNICRHPVYRYESHTISGSFVPLVGAQVLLRDTFTIGNEITNSQGYFQFDHKRGKKRYIIQWERYQYSIRNGNFWQAEYRGPKQNSRWNHNIKGGEEEYFANIHRGAHLYYYGDIGELTRPPSNDGFWTTQVKIAGIDKDGTSSHKQQFRYGGVAPRIKIKAYGEPTEQVIGTTIHELSHAVHWKIDQGAYNNLVWDAWISPCVPSAESCDHPGPTGANNRRLLESWATGVEIFLTRRYYRSRGESDYEYRNISLNGIKMGNFQNIQIMDPKGQFYTSVFWDMVDTFNQRTDYGSIYPTLPLDNVSGFTMSQLEDALKNAEYWTEYKNNIINQNPGISTTENINALFANWE